MLLRTLKSTILRGKNPQENLIAIFLSQINLDEHGITEINTIQFTWGGGGSGVLAPPPRGKEIFEKSGFSLFFFFFFFAFW